MGAVQYPLRFAPSRQGGGDLGQFAVQADLVAAGRIVVGESGHPVCHGGHADAQPGIAVTGLQGPLEGAVAGVGPQRPGQTVEQQGFPVQPQGGNGQWRAVQGAHFHLGGGAFQKGVRRIVETHHLAPGITVGMLAPPVMVLAAGPPVQHQGLAVQGQGATETNMGAADQGFGLGQGALVKVLR